MTSVLGFYGPSSKSDGSFVVYFSRDANLPITPGWIVTGLPGITGNVTIQEYNSNVYGDVVVNPGPPAISFPYLSNAIVYSDVPNAINIPSSISRFTVSPQNFGNVVTANATTTFGLYDQRIVDETKIVGEPVELRDLNSNVSTNEGKNTPVLLKNLGAGTAALLALSAFAPQDEYLFSNACSFIPHIRQHTRFAQYHTVTPLTGPNYIGTTVTVEIRPNEHGDILTNMYLALTLPPLMDASWTNPIGRAIFEKVEFMVEKQVIEKITDDWYILHDQMFLDASEKDAMNKAINGGYPEGNDVPANQPIDLMIPLDFFFTRRHSHGTESHQRLEVPGFPMCCVRKQKIYVRFTFRPQVWFTNYTPAIEFINPRLIMEEIILSDEERMYYQTKPFNLIVNHVENNSAQPYSQGETVFNLTGNYPINMMSFFIRRKTYEQLTSTYFGSRYMYGYTNQYYTAGIPLSPTSSYLDPIDYCNIYLNGQDILGSFANGTYFTYQQPFEHQLSVPTKRINTYVFGYHPKEFNKGGYIDFNKINSTTSKISIQFLKAYAPEIAANFSIYLYYYGYKILTFENGDVYATVTP